MKYIYAFILACLTGQLYSMDSIPHNEMDLVSYDRIVNNIKCAIDNKNSTEARQWLHRFELLADIDFHWFTSEQIEKYSDHCSSFYDNISTIESGQSDQSHSFNNVMKLKEQEHTWLKKMVENNQLGGIEWLLALDKSEINITIPSPEMLKEERMQQLNKSGTIATMDCIEKDR